MEDFRGPVDQSLLGPPQADHSSPSQASASDSSIPQAPAGGSNSVHAMTGVCSEAEDDSGDTALRPEGGGVAKSTWKFMLPTLPVHYISGVEDLLNVPAGDTYVQPPVSFAAIDSIAILGGTAYLLQITEDVERNITVGLLSVLTCLPSHLEVRFVWALPAHVWERTFNRKPIPQIASLSYPSTQGRAHSKEHVQTAEKSTTATAESAEDGSAAEADVFGVGRQAIK